MLIPYMQVFLISLLSLAGKNFDTKVFKITFCFIVTLYIIEVKPDSHPQPDIFKTLRLSCQRLFDFSIEFYPTGCPKNFLFFIQLD